MEFARVYEDGNSVQESRSGIGKIGCPESPCTLLKRIFPAVRDTENWKSSGRKSDRPENRLYEFKMNFARVYEDGNSVLEPWSGIWKNWSSGESPVRF